MTRGQSRSAAKNSNTGADEGARFRYFLLFALLRFVLL
jgi:hypothetical protein